MFFIVYVLAYALLCLYTGHRTLKFLAFLLPAIPPTLFWVLFGLFALTFLLGFFVSATGFGRMMKFIAGVWAGLFLNLMLYSAFFDLLTLLGIVPRTRAAAAIALVLVFVTVITGLINARTVKKKLYDVTVQKSSPRGPLKIALFADLHIGGVVGVRRIEHIARMINEQQVDLILLAGDIFDNDMNAVRHGERLKAAFLSMRSTYGAFACQGNHDVDRDVQNITAFLEQAGITLLRDERRLIDGRFYLVGRIDPDPIGYLNRPRVSMFELLKDIDAALPVIVIDHQPRAFGEIRRAGGDLAVSGHTHNGQMFPLNLAVRLFYKNGYGHKRFDTLETVVTSGAGTWGPPMRTGSRSEVVFITLRFKNKYLL